MRILLRCVKVSEYSDGTIPSNKAHGGVDGWFSTGLFCLVGIMQESPKALLTLSMKGGVGKTTTAIGLVRALRDREYKVGLLHLDIHGSSIPRALDLRRDSGYNLVLGGRLRPLQLDGFQLFSVGLLSREDTPNMWQGKEEEYRVPYLADVPSGTTDERARVLEEVVCQVTKMGVLSWLFRNQTEEDAPEGLGIGVLGAADNRSIV